MLQGLLILQTGLVRSYMQHWREAAAGQRQRGLTGQALSQSRAFDQAQRLFTRWHATYKAVRCFKRLYCARWAAAAWSCELTSIMHAERTGSAEQCDTANPPSSPVPKACRMPQDAACPSYAASIKVSY